MSATLWDNPTVTIKPTFKEIARKTVQCTYGEEELTDNYYIENNRTYHYHKNWNWRLIAYRKIFLYPLKLVELLANGLYLFADRLTLVGEIKPGDTSSTRRSTIRTVVRALFSIPLIFIVFNTSPINAIVRPLKNTYKDNKDGMPKIFWVAGGLFVLTLTLSLMGFSIYGPLAALIVSGISSVFGITIAPTVAAGLAIAINCYFNITFSLGLVSMSCDNQTVKEFWLSSPSNSWLNFRTHPKADTFEPNEFTYKMVLKCMIGMDPSRAKGGYVHLTDEKEGAHTGPREDVASTQTANAFISSYQENMMRKIDAENKAKGREQPPEMREFLENCREVPGSRERAQQHAMAGNPAYAKAVASDEKHNKDKADGKSVHSGPPAVPPRR